MNQFKDLRTRVLLSTSPVWVIVLLFVLCGMFAVFAIVVPPVFLRFWQLSVDHGNQVFRSAQWYVVLFELGVFGALGFFSLKAANRCADLLLDRLGMK